MSSDTFFMNSDIDIDSLPILFHFLKPEKHFECICPQTKLSAVSAYSVIAFPVS